ncbi:hypothetical protein H8356DRAFT_1339862 [Neocallimastix lanati (nom. inval.)]|nr:hypothetical protein H8356DRAFT_1339862 [Neocallimastix sp. JGI-2020a]
MKFFSINHGRNINIFHSNALQKKKNKNILFTINNLENIERKGKEEDNTFAWKKKKTKIHITTTYYFFYVNKSNQNQKLGKRCFCE